jgi:hypothetical protein
MGQLFSTPAKQDISIELQTASEILEGNIRDFIKDVQTHLRNITGIPNLTIDSSGWKDTNYPLNNIPGDFLVLHLEEELSGPPHLSSSTTGLKKVHQHFNLKSYLAENAAGQLADLEASKASILTTPVTSIPKAAF